MSPLVFCCLVLCVVVCSYEISGFHLRSVDSLACIESVDVGFDLRSYFSADIAPGSMTFCGFVTLSI